MILFVKLLSGEILEIETEPTMKSIRDAILCLHPEWEFHPMRWFTMDSGTGEINVNALKDGDTICLFVDDPCYVRIFTNSEHLLFSLSVSSLPDFSYPHTQTLFFEFTGSVFYDYSQRHDASKLEAMIRNSHEFPNNQLEYIIKEAQRQWDLIMETYAEKRADYLRRLHVVQSVDN